MKSIFALSHTHVSTSAQKTRFFKAHPGSLKIMKVDGYKPTMIPCAPTPQIISRRGNERRYFGGKHALWDTGGGTGGSVTGETLIDDFHRGLVFWV